MSTYPAPRPRSRRQAPWPRIIVLVIILGFVLAMTALGCAPEAAAGIATGALAAVVSPAQARELPDGQA